MLGNSRKEIIGTELARIVHRDDVSWVMERHAAHLRGEPIPRTIHRAVKKSGEVVWVESIGQQIEWEGRPAIMYFTSDVTDRQHAEELLRKSEEKYRSSEIKYRNLIEVAPEAVWVIEDQKVIFFNNHALEMLGYSHTEMMGLPLRAIIHDEDWGGARERYLARSQGMLLPKSVCRQVTKGGEASLGRVCGPADSMGEPARGPVLLFRCHREEEAGGGVRPVAENGGRRSSCRRHCP